jgi:hypothetical protein
MILAEADVGVLVGDLEICGGMEGIMRASMTADQN